MSDKDKDEATDPDEALDAAWTDYAAHFREKVLPRLTESEVFLSVGTETAEMFDVKQAVELGAALLLDKPILLVVPKGRQLNPHLRRCADAVVEDWHPGDPDGPDRLMAAMKELGVQPPSP